MHFKALRLLLVYRDGLWIKCKCLRLLDFAMSMSVLTSDLYIFFVGLGTWLGLVKVILKASLLRRIAFLPMVKIDGHKYGGYKKNVR